MLYNPVQYRHPIIKNIPYKPIHFQIKKKTHWWQKLGWLFQIIAYAIIDVIINTIFAIIDVVAGILTDGTADVALVAGEVAIDEALQGAETASLAGRVTRTAIRISKNAKKISKELKLGFKSKKGLKKIGSFYRAFDKSRGEKLITRSIMGKAANEGSRLISSQAISGITFNGSGFGFNREIWKSGNTWLFNGIFGALSIARSIRGSFGKSFLNTFQNFLHHSVIASTDPRLKDVYAQMMKIIADGQESLIKDADLTGDNVKFTFSMKDLLNNFKKYDLTKEDQAVIIEFKKLISEGTNSKGYGRLWFRVYKIYNRLFVSKPNTWLGQKMRRLYEISTTLKHTKIRLTEEETSEAFENWFKRHIKRVNVKPADFPNEEFGFYKQAQFERFQGIYGLKRGYFEGTTKQFYEIQRSQGILGNFINYIGKTKDDLTAAERIQKRYFINNLDTSKWTYPLTRLSYHFIDKEVLWFIDAFESWFLQYITSPIYALDRLAVNVIRMIKKSAAWRIVVERANFKLVNKFLDVATKMELGSQELADYKEYVRSRLSPEGYRAFKDYLAKNINNKEFNHLIRKNYEDYEFVIGKTTPFTRLKKMIGKIKGKIHKGIQITRTKFGFENQEGKLTDAEYRKKIRGLKNFIPFEYSSILGVQIHSKTVDGVSHDFIELSEIDASSEGEPISWTIYFAQSTRKGAIFQSNVVRRIAKGFIQCGLTNSPLGPWAFYNKYIAWGKRFTAFLGSVNQALFSQLPSQATPLRYYYLDLSSAKETAQTHVYQKLFTNGLKSTQIAKVIAYGSLKNVGGRNLRFGGVSFRSLGGSLGSVLVTSVAERQRANQSAGRLGRRIARLRSYQFFRI